MGDEAAVAELCLRLGQMRESRGDVEAARSLISEALHLSRGSANALGMAESYDLLGFLAQTQGAFGEAEGRYEQALKCAERAGDHVVAVRVEVNRAQLRILQGDIAGAEEWLERCKRRSERELVEMPTELHFGLGRIALVRGDQEEAVTQHLAGLAAARRKGAHLLEAAHLSALAHIQRQRSEVQNAEAHCSQALEIYQTAGHAAGLRAMNTLMADLCLLLRDFERMESHLRAAMESCYASGDLALQASNHVTIGRALVMQQGDRPKAVVEWLTALRIYERLGMEKQRQSVQELIRG